MLMKMTLPVYKAAVEDVHVVVVVIVVSVVVAEVVVVLQLLVKEMVMVLLRHFKQTQDFTSFPRQAIIAHQSKLISYFRA